MPHPVSRRGFLIGAAGASAALAIGAQQAPAQKKAANLRLWILKTYVEPTNKAIEASAADAPAAPIRNPRRLTGCGMLRSSSNVRFLEVGPLRTGLILVERSLARGESVAAVSGALIVADHAAASLLDLAK